MFIECESKWGVLSVVLYFIEDKGNEKKIFYNEVLLILKILKIVLLVK